MRQTSTLPDDWLPEELSTVMESELMDEEEVTVEIEYENPLASDDGFGSSFEFESDLAIDFDGLDESVPLVL
jgi:hypothetical protein